MLFIHFNVCCTTSCFYIPDSSKVDFHDDFVISECLTNSLKLFTQPNVILGVAEPSITLMENYERVSTNIKAMVAIYEEQIDTQ